MKWQHTKRSENDYNDAPMRVQKDFDKAGSLFWQWIYDIHPFVPRSKTKPKTCGKRE